MLELYVVGFKEHLITNPQRTYDGLNRLLIEHPLSFFRLCHLPEGYAFVQAYDLEEAFDIMNILNSTPLDGIQLRCELSRSTTTAMKRVLGRIATPEDIPTWEADWDNFPASLNQVQQYRSSHPDGYYPASRRPHCLEAARGHSSYDKKEFVDYEASSEDSSPRMEEESWGANWGNKLSAKEEKILEQAQDKLSPYEKSLQQRRLDQEGEQYKHTLQQENRFQAKQQARVNDQLMRECALLKKQKAQAINSQNLMLQQSDKERVKLANSQRHFQQQMNDKARQASKLDEQLLRADQEYKLACQFNNESMKNHYIKVQAALSQKKLAGEQHRQQLVAQAERAAANIIADEELNKAAEQAVAATDAYEAVLAQMKDASLLTPTPPSSTHSDVGLLPWQKEMITSGFIPAPHQMKESEATSGEFYCFYCGELAPAKGPCWANLQPKADVQ